ncbi:MAG: YjbH domain-containing protein [Alphaproteobacteria bacterium]|nr:YjbH domain-containing protein [Alphaproteobacteria bacterium]
MGTYLKKNNFTHAFKFILEQKLSLSESDTGTLYRTSALLEAEKTWPFGIMNGASARANLTNNLSRLNDYRFRAINPIRSDEDLFAARRFGIDRFYATWMKTLGKDTHAALTVGYLEEMYGGFGGEILYRPFKKTLAIGAEGWQTYKRDPLSVLNKNLNPDYSRTGHLNLFYEIPNTNTTAYFKAGKYLRGDVGGSLGLKKLFTNGSSLEGFLTTTNQRGLDILGKTTHLYGGIRFTLPLGNIPYIPDGSEIRFSTGPLARDIGQTLDKPQPLYEATEPISYRQLNQSWNHLLE